MNKQARKYTITKGKFIKHDLTEDSFIEINSGSHSPEWSIKQENSMQEYIDELTLADPQIEDIYRILEHYIAKTISGKSGLNILDVGCGIGSDYPKYARFLENGFEDGQNTYIGLDPIPFQVDRRKYPFICGRIEDVQNEVDLKFDLFLFASCLDHFEDIERVAGEIKEISHPNALAIIWIGLHDRSIVGEQVGAKLFPSLYSDLNVFSFLGNYIKMNIRMIEHYLQLRKREKRLANGTPLDQLHFHYFTEDSIKKYLDLFGETIDSLKVIGTNSMFYTVRLKP